MSPDEGRKTFDDLSFLLQDGIILRLAKIEDAEMRYQIHHLCCLVITKLLSSRAALEMIKMKKATLAGLNLSKYSQDSATHAKHRAACIQAAKHLLSNLPNRQPLEIVSDNQQLFKLMREIRID